MLDLSWKVFSKTGSVNTYLLIKELERSTEDDGLEQESIEELDRRTH